MRILSATVQDVMSWNPCQPDYPESRVVELWAGRERLTAREILGLDVPSSDRLWAVLRPELLPENLLHEFDWEASWEADWNTAWNAAWNAVGNEFVKMLLVKMDEADIA